MAPLKHNVFLKKKKRHKCVGYFMVVVVFLRVWFFFLVVLNQMSRNQQGHFVATALGCLFPPGLHSHNI